MQPEIQKLLLDILESIEAIEDYLGEERDFLVFMKQKMMRRAVERELEIIGEATKKLESVDAGLQISNKSKIIGTRNRVIHGYDEVDYEIIWGIIVRHIPKLKQEILDLLKV
jgi:uncharacterized protein with HEPN domain